jgi:predicted RNA-binding Zn-ribbon protein involved in translation (DUF1610 family)
MCEKVNDLLSNGLSISKIIKKIASAQKHGYISKCPRCGWNRMQCTNDLTTFGSLSRRADIYVCDECGMFEALEDYCGLKKLPLSEWALFGKGDEQE